mmetsp:Transcript_90853/g.231196  ORF Transcript_90853/g.231196 Transcript_90853/m.231196 type:complete len:226 (+) Transcript_90853:444-1121(+)
MNFLLDDKLQLHLCLAIESGNIQGARVVRHELEEVVLVAKPLALLEDTSLRVPSAGLSIPRSLLVRLRLSRAPIERQPSAERCLRDVFLYSHKLGGDVRPEAACAPRRPQHKRILRAILEVVDVLLEATLHLDMVVHRLCLLDPAQDVLVILGYPEQLLFSGVSIQAHRAWSPLVVRPRCGEGTILHDFRHLFQQDAILAIYLRVSLLQELLALEVVPDMVHLLS